jgi:rhodanese-related sulfurtransferase
MPSIEEIDSHQLSAWMEADPEGFLLVDVRSPAEMAQGVLPNAERVPMHLVPVRMGEWRNQTKIVFYCRSGARSAQVCVFLQQQGFSQVFNLGAGIIDWYRQGTRLKRPGLPACPVNQAFPGCAFNRLIQRFGLRLTGSYPIKAAHLLEPTDG